jgi:hypothetical protein
MWLASVVALAHAAFLVFMIAAPFGSCRQALVLHALVTPFLWVHWALSDDTCFLTLVEKRLRGLQDNSESFMHRLVSPIYNIRDADVRTMSWAASLVLWLVTLSRVRRRDFVDFVS